MVSTSVSSQDVKPDYIILPDEGLLEIWKDADGLLVNLVDMEWSDNHVYDRFDSLIELKNSNIYDITHILKTNKITRDWNLSGDHQIHLKGMDYSYAVHFLKSGNYEVYSTPEEFLCWSKLREKIPEVKKIQREFYTLIRISDNDIYGYVYTKRGGHLAAYIPFWEIDDL